MLRHNQLEHRFIQYIPDDLESGVVYISMEFATAAHSCCCGCGEQVITPFTPTDWKLTFDGETISLWPSIGNWNFRCRSHYIIRESRIVWADAWDDKEIEGNRKRDKQRKQDFYSEKKPSTHLPSVTTTPSIKESPGFWSRLRRTWDKWDD